MSDASNNTPSPSPKKSANEKDKPASKSHPPTATMVKAAITHLNERSGSSISAIKKYIAGTYNIDPETRSIFIKKYVKNAVLSGELVQTSGKGASGSFRFPTKRDIAKKKEAELQTSDQEEEAPKKSKKEVKSNSKPASPKKKKAETKKGTKLTSEKEEKSKPESASPKKKKAETKKGSKSKSPKEENPKMKKTQKSPTKTKLPKKKEADKPTSPKKAAAKPKAKK